MAGFFIPGWDMSKGDIGNMGAEAMLPLRSIRSLDATTTFGPAGTLAVNATIPPCPPVTKPVLFDGYPLRHVIGYSLIEQWVEVLVFDDDERPIWNEGRWQTERLSGKVERLEEPKP